MSEQDTAEQATGQGSRAGTGAGGARLGTVVFDTPDPRGLAAFYGELLGWTRVEDDDDWVTLRGEGPVTLSFQLSKDLVKPTWPTPDIPQQAHLDIDVADYAEPEARVLALGATLLEGSEEHATFRVYADPSGHPFCLCLES